MDHPLPFSLSLVAPEDITPDGNIIYAKPLNPAQKLIKNIQVIRSEGHLVPKVVQEVTNEEDTLVDDKDKEITQQLKALEVERQAVTSSLRMAVVDIVSAIELIDYLLKPPQLPQLPPGQVLHDPPYWYKEIDATHFPHVVSQSAPTQLYDVQYTFGTKKQQIQQTVDYLRNHARQLDSVIDSEFSFFAQQGVRLRGNGWKIRQRTTITGVGNGSTQEQLFVDYGYQLAGSIFRERGYADIHRFNYHQYSKPLIENEEDRKEVKLSSLVYINIPHRQRKSVVLTWSERGVVHGMDLQMIEEEEEEEEEEQKKLNHAMNYKNSRIQEEDPSVLHKRLITARENIFQAEVFETLLDEARRMVHSGVTPIVPTNVSSDNKIRLTIDTTADIVLTIEYRTVKGTGKEFNSPISKSRFGEEQVQRWLREANILLQQLLCQRHQWRQRMHAHGPSRHPYARGSSTGPEMKAGLPSSLISYVSSQLTWQMLVYRTDQLLSRHARAIAELFRSSVKTSVRYRSRYMHDEKDHSNSSIGRMARQFHLQFGATHFTVTVSAPSTITANTANSSVTLSDPSRLDSLVRYELEQQLRDYVSTRYRRLGSKDVLRTQESAEGLRVVLNGTLLALN